MFRRLAQDRSRASEPPLDLRGDLFEADHAREFADFALLVFAQPHQQRHRRPDQLLHFGAVGVDVRPCRPARACAPRNWVRTTSRSAASTAGQYSAWSEVSRSRPFRPAIWPSSSRSLCAGGAGGGGSGGFACLGLSARSAAARRRLDFGGFAAAAGAGGVPGIGRRRGDHRIGRALDCRYRGRSRPARRPAWAPASAARSRRAACWSWRRGWKSAAAANRSAKLIACSAAIARLTRLA